MNDLLTVAEAAQFLRIHRVSAYNLIARDEFPVPVIRVGKHIRISRHELERLVGKPTEGHTT